MRIPQQMLLILLGGLIVISGCGKDERTALERVIPVIRPYLAKELEETGTRPIKVEAGAYKKGYAVITPIGAAYWVKGDVAYWVNDEASEYAPDIEQAPEHIQYTSDFIVAAMLKER